MITWTTAPRFRLQTAPWRRLPTSCPTRAHAHAGRGQDTLAGEHRDRPSPAGTARVASSGCASRNTSILPHCEGRLPRRAARRARLRHHAHRQAAAHVGQRTDHRRVPCRLAAGRRHHRSACGRASSPSSTRALSTVCSGSTTAGSTTPTTASITISCAPSGAASSLFRCPARRARCVSRGAPWKISARRSSTTERTTGGSRRTTRAMATTAAGKRCRATASAAAGEQCARQPRLPERSRP